MKKFTLLSVLVFVLVNQIFLHHAFAYSYGDPNEEKIAEVYKEMQLKLDKTPPDYAAAKEVYGTVQEEVDMHMGKEPSEVILKNIEEEDKENVINNMEKLLVLNIARRLESIEGKFAEYDTSKKLLAKGFATYEALSPKVESADPELDQTIRSQFELALKSLGNPGLFGVGKQESDLEAFKSSKEEILAALQAKFNMESLEVGHFSESATELETNSGKKDWTDLSNLKNWLPLLIIIGVMVGIVSFTLARKKKKG